MCLAVMSPRTVGVRLSTTCATSATLVGACARIDASGILSCLNAELSMLHCRYGTLAVKIRPRTTVRPVSSAPLGMPEGNASCASGSPAPKTNGHPDGERAQSSRASVAGSAGWRRSSSLAPDPTTARSWIFVSHLSIGRNARQRQADTQTRQHGREPIGAA